MDGQPGQAASAPQLQMGPDDVDRLVKQRLEQAFHGVFRKLIDTSERAARAAEASASTTRLDGLTKSLKLDQWKPGTREEELKTWKEWAFQFTNWLVANDPGYESDLEELDLEKEVDHDVLPDEKEIRSQRLFGVLCNLLKGRPLYLVKQVADKRNGLEAWRLLRREMEPKEKARALAMVRQLASWRFDEKTDLHSQLIRYEEALRTYAVSSGKEFPEELVLATVVTGLREPLSSQVQLQMTSETKFSDVREWILRYKSLNAPWAATFDSKDSGGVQPMDVDVIKGKGKDSKGKGKDSKGKGKDGKGKDTKGKKGKPGSGKGGFDSLGKSWQSGQGSGWSSSQGGGWSSGWSSGGWNQQPKGKGKKGLDPNACAICGRRGHWKNECPQKGKGKVNQVEQQMPAASLSSGASTSASSVSMPSSASAMKGQAGYAVNRVELFSCETPRSCKCTEVFDMTELNELEDGYDFGLAGAEVMVVSCPDLPVSDFGRHLQGGHPGLPHGPDRQRRELDSWPWRVRRRARQLCGSGAGPAGEEIVIDSGADISVAPLKLAQLGKAASASGVVMQDAQGRRIPEKERRILDIEVETADGDSLVIREKFCIAPVASVILSMGRLLRWGWSLATYGGRPVIERGGHKVPIKLRRNTLTILATVAAITTNAVDYPNEPNTQAHLCPPEAPSGWRILPSGLPFYVAHHVDELSLEQSLWEDGDWTWVAVFVRVEQASRRPEPGNMWVQALTLKVEDLAGAPKLLSEVDSELSGRHDVTMVLHVEELAKDLLTNPRDIFAAPADDNMAAPLPEPENAAGIGEEVEGVAAESRELRGAREDDSGEAELEGVKLSVETPLKDLKELCRKLGLAVSGGKNKILRRLKVHHEVLEKQLASEVARKMFAEQERNPGMLKTPTLPSSRQQELHNITHHPFQPWCEACVLGRSRQSPHRRQGGENEGESKELPEPSEAKPVIQLDYSYSYTFTKLRGEMAEGEQQPTDDQGQPGQAGQEGQEGGDEPVDVRDQHGLCLLAAESTTGWIAAIPVLEKGSNSLKRVAEQIVRLTLQVSPGGTVVLQSDTEPSAKQVVNAVSACRSKLGLTTETQSITKGSYASNGRVEKAVDTIRRNALTLKAWKATSTCTRGLPDMLLSSTTATL